MMDIYVMLQVADTAEVVRLLTDHSVVSTEVKQIQIYLEQI